MNSEVYHREQAVALLDAARSTIGPGTLVTLKTGGPSMVVAERSADKINALWHSEDGELCQFWFPVHCLKVKA